MRVTIYITLLTFMLSGCASEVKYYACDDGEKNCWEMPVMSGDEKSKVTISIDTDGGYPYFATERPRIFLDYTSKPSQIDSLKYLGVRLIVDGQDVKADGDEYTAHYITHTSSTVTFKEDECCSGLGAKLGINIDPKDVDHSDQFHSVKLTAKKDFVSLGKLPEKFTFIVTATTDKGTTEMERSVALASRKSSDFIRIH